MDHPQEIASETPQKDKEVLDLEAKMGALSSPEERIGLGLAFMRTAISQEGAPRFRSFWEARRLVLELFKGNVNVAIRSRLWTECVELTQEARRLKDLLEEQGAFAAEQIELAISGLEKEVAEIDATIAASAPIEIAVHSKVIEPGLSEYQKLQCELAVLNSLATRLSALRKEVVTTSMRLKLKTKFFKQLSTLGDAIFPRRKGLVDEISKLFERDIAAFINAHFKGAEIVGAPYFALREEIKALQAMAKIFTLSSQAFNRTRLSLSQCWDKVREQEKEYKKGKEAEREAAEPLRAAFAAKVEEFAKTAEAMELLELDREIDAIIDEMNQTNLHRQDVRALTDRLLAFRAPHVAKQELRAKELEAAEKEALRVKRETLGRLKEKIAELLREGHQMDPVALEEAHELLVQELKTLSVPKIEQQQIDRSIRQLKTLVAERKERSLLNLTGTDAESFQMLEKLLKEKKARRQEIKEQLEQHRRALGSSNLDFEKAMLYRELVTQEKDLLEKTNAGIEEIEQKIAELSS